MELELCKKIQDCITQEYKLNTKKKEENIWAEDALPQDEGQGSTAYVDDRYKELACTIVEATVKDYKRDYKSLMKRGFTHDEAVEELRSGYEPFFLDNPLCSLCLPDTEGIDIYISVIDNLKKGVI